jgi:hypothetical protein
MYLLVLNHHLKVFLFPARPVNLHAGGKRPWQGTALPRICLLRSTVIVPAMSDES